MIRALVLSLFACAFSFAVEVGTAAPDFELKSHEGKMVKLSDYKGKTVVLEWTNIGCPFVRAHYEPGAMQKLQGDITSKGVVWLQILSSAPGKEGYLATAEDAKKLYEERKMKSTAFLLDPTGSVGKSYGAKTTPHMFIVDKEGKLVYAGAIDAHPRPQYNPGAQNYITQAVEEILNDKPVSISSTKPYGCSVKY